MNRVEYIRCGLSVKQMQLLYELALNEMARKHKNLEPEEPELDYAAELLKKALE